MNLDRIGLWTSTLDSLSVSQLRDVAQTLDESGLQSLWFGEAYGREAFSLAQFLLSQTERLQVGTGIANIYARDPFAVAGAGRTLHALSGGRFVAGLGVSHAPLVERLRGSQYGKPLSTMREYLQGLAAAPALVATEAELPPVVLAALGPKMLELSRDAADGAHPYLVGPEHTAQAREILDQSPDGSEKLLVVEQAAVVDPGADHAEWQKRSHSHLEIYTGLPNYRASWKRQGFDENDYVRGGSDRLKKAMVTHGVEATLQRIDEHFAAGATSVVVQVLGADGSQPPIGDWAILAEELQDN